jgi:hypothetical protein
MAGKIFINYRRDDDAGFTQALYQRLEDAFSPESLFMDVEGHIRPGDDFVDILTGQVAASDVLLVVIGPRWLDQMTARQDDPNDFVVIEITAALTQGKRVIPVLVGGAAMPRADALPDSVKALARRNAVGLRPERFKSDCQGLIAALSENLAAAAQDREARTFAERQAAEAERREVEAQSAARAAAADALRKAQLAAGLSAEEIRKAEELANWDFVKSQHDVDDVRDHIARFPNGPTARYAVTKLDDLVWAGFGDMPNREQLSAYLDEFPNGRQSEAARKQISRLDAQATAARESADNEAKEARTWAGLATSTDPATIQSFLDTWPEGTYANQARTRLAEIRRDGAGRSVASTVLVLGLTFAAVVTTALTLLLLPVLLSAGPNSEVGTVATIWLGSVLLTIVLAAAFKTSRR